VSELANEPSNTAVSERSDTASVAVVGAGRMGSAMAGRLRAADLSVVVYNRTRDKAEAAAENNGATVAPTARDAVAGADVVLVSLADDDAVRAAYAGDDGLLAGVREGVVVCDTSTVAPETVREIAPQVSERGGRLLDAPVSGSVPLVERGELTVMVGGDPAALETARPVLDHLAKAVFHLGDVGAGATMKLVVNAVIFALNAAVSEALVVAEKAGVGRAATYDVLQASAAGAPYVHYKRDAFLRPDDAPVAFSLDLVAKDQRLIDALAGSVGASTPQADVTRELVAAAVLAGLGAHDMSAVAEYLRRSDPPTR
jgi:3-hydroxyisobutyrate dehydrogenase-like beta-hydroxyacid dehydrogenase